MSRPFWSTLPIDCPVYESFAAKASLGSFKLYRPWREVGRLQTLCLTFSDTWIIANLGNHRYGLCDILCDLASNIDRILFECPFWPNCHTLTRQKLLRRLQNISHFAKRGLQMLSGRIHKKLLHSWRYPVYRGMFLLPISGLTMIRLTLSWT
jgi:hypothetical protein